MSADLGVVLTSEDLYHLLSDQFGQVRDGVTENSFNIKGLRNYLVKRFSKNQLKQYLSVDQQSSRKSTRFVFLGDDYDEIENVSQLGLRTILYNPRGELVAESMPAQDADILHFGCLKKIESIIDKKPLLKTCFDWWDVWDVPENVRLHATQVARAAYILAVMLRKQGENVDPILAHRGGLLHDIDKIATLDLVNAHGTQGAEFLGEQGYPELAKIVREHIMSTILDSDINDRGWENKLVFFCDKLVEGENIIPFDQRLEALKKRYPAYRELMNRSENRIWQLNDEICSKLRIQNHNTLISMLLKF